MTKKMLERAVQTKSGAQPPVPAQKFSYDAHSDWELSRLLTVLDEQIKDPELRKDPEKLEEIKQLAETCVSVLETQTESAEIFIQLAERILKKNDYSKLDKLSDLLLDRFPAGEIAEIVRSTDTAQIRAIAYETLALMPVNSLLPLLDDPIYAEIAMNAIEQKAFEYESEEARDLLERIDQEAEMGN
jgi:hypothetical protein